MLVERYGLDALRYYLMREVKFGHDGIFTPDNFINRINYDLANDLGNLLNRTVSMVNKYLGGQVGAYPGQITDFDASLEDLITSEVAAYRQSMDDLQFSVALDHVWKSSLLPINILMKQRLGSWPKMKQKQVNYNQ